MTEPKTKIEELEEKLAASRTARALAETEQYAKDLEARIALEDQYGNIAAVQVARFTPGQPTRAYLKTPTGPQYKKYKDLIYRAAGRKDSGAQQDAAEGLARACWVYPAKEQQEAMLEAFPGLLTPLANAAAALAEGKSEDEKNG